MKGIFSLFALMTSLPLLLPDAFMKRHQSYEICIFAIEICYVDVVLTQKVQTISVGLLSNKIQPPEDLLIKYKSILRNCDCLRVTVLTPA